MDRFVEAEEVKGYVVFDDCRKACEVVKCSLGFRDKGT